MRCLQSCTEVTGYTWFLACLQESESVGVKSGDLGGHTIGVSAPVHLPREFISRSYNDD
jgi:hypothetical protein